MPVEIPDPWLAFLQDVDGELSQPVEVHCLGGFVLLVQWKRPWPTGDVDFITVAPSEAIHELVTLAGEGSEIAQRRKLHFHSASVAECPEDYVSRLVELTPPGFSKLRLQGLEVHDLVLAKLGRNIARDRDDVAFLVRQGALDRKVLEDRYESELRPYVINEHRHTAALTFWLEEFFT